MLKKICEILKNAREDLDMTQIDVMKATGINNKTLSGYENGISEPDIETFAKLLSLYGLSADYVLNIKKASDEKTVILKGNENLLVEHYRKLSKTQQEDFIKMITALTKA